MNYLLIFLGGGVGSLLRYFIGFWITEQCKRYCFLNIPVGTLFVNVLGSLLIGLALGYFLNNQETLWFKFLFVIGFCGGFTTFSTFSNETLILLKTGRFLEALLYVFISVTVSLSLTGVGYLIIKKI